MKLESIANTDQAIQDLIDLCLNNLDSYSAILFGADSPGAPLKIKAYQTLSRNLNPKIEIYSGEGLVGWAYKHKEAVNVNQLDYNTERLLFYRTDENIKSFMAIPLGDLPMVLAVDSKQRYIFSDKSAKLLFHFGQSIERAWKKIAGKNAPVKTGEPSVDVPVENLNAVSAFWHEVEQMLSTPDRDGGGLLPVIDLAQKISGLNWAFLTALLPGDNKNYHIIAGAPDLPKSLTTTVPLGQGLAGWLHTKLQNLALDKIRADGHHSYIFHKDEPLKNLGTFYGWPLIYGQSLRGSLILTGSPGQSLTSEVLEVMDCLALRLSSQMQHDRLVVRVVELSRLEPQTGLYHRSYFTERLGRLLEIASLSGKGAQLFILAVSGLGEFAIKGGNEANKELLRSIGHELLSVGKPGWDFGHLSYGVFALAVPKEDALDAQNILTRFQKRLADWPLSGHSGRVNLGLSASTALFPENGKGPEEIIEAALSALADASNVYDA